MRIIIVLIFMTAVAVIPYYCHTERPDKSNIYQVRCVDGYGESHIYEYVAEEKKSQDFEEDLCETLLPDRERR